MDCEAVSVSPMSLAALDALKNLPTEFIEPLDISQRQNIVDSFARLNFLTEGMKQPKLFQLKCLMSLLASRHVVVWAATGAGETLAMILPLLLSPNKIAITVTPLKLLQKDHVHLTRKIQIMSLTFLDLSVGQQVCPVWHSLHRNQP
jgi:Lhr-like helicase